MTEHQDLQEQLDSALAEIDRLRDENTALRKALSLSNKPAQKRDAVGRQRRWDPGANLSGAQKVQLFRSLFGGREDAYAVRWVSSKGIAGYSPVHSHKSDTRQCRRPRQECEKLGERLYFPLTDMVIYEHLAGKHEVGISPLLEDDTCCFLAIDLDKRTWSEDVAAFLQTCSEKGVAAYPERSRSGSGAHVWIFFETPVLARKARNLGMLLLDAASNRRFAIGLDSFDRMFPNQDLLPRGGFGNLIALHFQRQARVNGNSVFLDGSLRPAHDQWGYLCGVQKLSKEQLEESLRAPFPMAISSSPSLVSCYLVKRQARVQRCPRSAARTLLAPVQSGFASRACY